MPEDTPLPPEVPFAGEEDIADDDAETGDESEDVLDRMRGTGVGVEDPAIVGDVGPEGLRD